MITIYIIIIVIIIIVIIVIIIIINLVRVASWCSTRDSLLKVTIARFVLSGSSYLVRIYKLSIW